MNSYPDSVLQFFETSIPTEVRFMVDANMSGMNWLLLRAGSYKILEPAARLSRCQIEVSADWRNVVSFEPVGEWSAIAPLRVLSFDIECAGRKGTFPDPRIDPVIQIASVLSVHGHPDHLTQDVFTLRSCAHINGAVLHTFEEEKQLLVSWARCLLEADPDVIIGYNISNFDFPYLINRAIHLGATEFLYLGRLKSIQALVKNTFFSSKAYGTRESKWTHLEGRLQLDMLQVMQRDHKLRSYSLNSVSAHFLASQKEDVPHSIITDLFNGDENTRHRLAVYCLKDAVLPLRLMEKLMCLVNYIEMARVTRVPFNFLLARGQQIKVLTQLCWKAKDRGYFIPDVKTEGSDEQYEGATVIEPIKGFYENPIATLDFASLYPSIMIAHNLCYTTLLQRSDIDKFGLPESDLIFTPSGNIFVGKKVRKGLLPEILEDLINARKKAKLDLKQETDPFKRAVLDGRQLALKVSANSVYGFTGATVGKLPCIPISQSVTAFGREMIEQTQKIVENSFKSQYKLKFAKVIYGDTDSVMIDFGESEIEKTMELGRLAAKYISSNFTSPISLEFEKCYFPYLLINKKRYAGLLWTKPTAYDKMDTKGIETVRRDNCRLVQSLIDNCLQLILIEKDVEAAKRFNFF